MQSEPIASTTTYENQEFNIESTTQKLVRMTNYLSYCKSVDNFIMLHVIYMTWIFLYNFIHLCFYMEKYIEYSKKNMFSRNSYDARIHNSFIL